MFPSKENISLAQIKSDILAKTVKIASKTTIDTSQTWTCPETGWYEVFACGGGGGGATAQNIGGNACGGGGSGHVCGLFYLNKGEQVVCTIGAGGIASTSWSSAGGTGGTTTFGSYLTAIGANGGPAATGSYVGNAANSVNGGGGGSGSSTGTAPTFHTDLLADNTMLSRHHLKVVKNSSASPAGNYGGDGFGGKGAVGGTSNSNALPCVAGSYGAGGGGTQSGATYQTASSGHSGVILIFKY